MDAESYLFSIVEAIQLKERSAGLSALTSKERIFFLVWSLEADVNNGGFNQFFFNSAGDHAIESVAALRTIGAQTTAALADRALAVFGPKGPSKDRNVRQEELELFTEEQEEQLSELDTAFYAYPDNLSQLLAAYMRSQ